MLSTFRPSHSLPLLSRTWEQPGYSPTHARDDDDDDDAGNALAAATCRLQTVVAFPFARARDVIVTSSAKMHSDKIHVEREVCLNPFAAYRRAFFN